MMSIVLRYTKRSRPILSLPYSVGMLQGMILEQLPPNILTLTRSQVRAPIQLFVKFIRQLIVVQVEQLKADNVVNPNPSADESSFSDLLQRFYGEAPRSVHEILPKYL